MAYNAGTAFLQVVPSFRGLDKELAKGLNDLGREFAKTLDDVLPEGFTQASKRATRTAAPELTRTGRGLAGTFATAFHRRVEAAFKALPVVELTADSSDADQAVHALRERLAELHDKRIGVDISELQAMSQLLELKGLLAEITDSNVSVEINADTDRARQEVIGFFEDIKTEQQRAADAAARAAADAAVKAAEKARQAAEKAAAEQQADAKRAAEKAAAEAAKAAEQAARRAADAFARTFAGQTQTAIRNALLRLPDLQLHANSAPVERAIAAIRAQLTALGQQRIGIDIDETVALATIGHLQEQLQELTYADADVRFRFDAAAGAAELAMVAQMVDRLDGDDAHVDVNVEVDRGIGALGRLHDATHVSLGRLGLLVATGASLGTAVVPAAAAAATAIGFIGTAAAASTIAVGVIALGFSGIGDAVSALGKAHDDAGQSSASLGRAQSQVAGAVDQVAAAERGLANTRADNADAARRAARDVQQAELGLADALLAERRAQQDLTVARDQARRAMEDLTFSIEENALRQRQATLDVADAKETLDKLLANPRATKEEREQARITYEQALLQQKKLAEQQKRLTAERNAATKAGIDGSAQVQAAQERMADATARVADAQRRHADAVMAQNTQQRRAASALVEANQQVIAAQRALARAHTDAGVAGTGAMDKVRAAMDKLSPTGQRFARFVFGLKDEFYQLRTAASDGMLTGLQKAITSVLPGLPRLIRFVQRVSDTLGTLAVRAVDQLKDPTWRRLFRYIETTAVPTITMLFTAGANIARGMAGLFLAFTPLTGDVSDGILDVTQRFADWATTLDRNPAFQRFLAYAKESAPPVLEMLKQLGVLMLRFAEAAAPTGTFVITAFSTLFEWINKIPVDVLEVLVGAIAGAAAGLAVLAAVTSAMALGWAGAIVAGIAAVAAGLVVLYETVAPFRDAVNATFQTIAAGAVFLWQDILVPALTGIGATLAFLWTNYLYPLGQVFATVFGEIGQLVQFWWQNLVSPTFSAIGFVITKFLAPTLTWLYTGIVKPAFAGMELAFRIVGAAFQVLAGLFQIGVKVISGVIALLWTHGIKPKFEWMVPLFAWLGNVITKEVAPNFKAGLALLAYGFDILRAKASVPIKFVVQTLLNDGLLKSYNSVAKAFGVKPDDVQIKLPAAFDKPPVFKFADGGVLPGYTPGRDVHQFVSRSGTRLDLSGGEAIIRPEGTAALGAGWVDGINHAARTGGVTGVQQFLHSRHPGIGMAGARAQTGDGLGDLLHAARNKAGDVLSGIGDVLKNPAKVLRQMADKLIALVPGADNLFGRAVVAVPNRIAQMLQDTVTRIFTGNEGTHGGTGGIGSAAMMRILRGPFPDLPLISGYRPGAITATGNKSYHGKIAANGEKGRAVDVPPQWRVFNWLAARFPDSRELIFTPAGKRQIHNGNPHVFSGVTAANHYDHIHWALRHGGILPSLYDDGGYLPPGLSVVANGTGRPEPVLTDGQWKQLSDANRHAETRAAAQYHFQFRDSTLTPGRLRALQDREDALNRVHRTR